MDKLSYRLIANNNELEEAFEIRREVFVREQGISEELDFDGCDDEAMQMIVKAGERIIGTARVRFLSASQAKIERMAVLNRFRNKGIGRGIITFLEGELQNRNIKESVLHAQHSAVGFYKACGFKETVSPFWEAGIKHIKMRKKL